MSQKMNNYNSTSIKKKQVIAYAAAAAAAATSFLPQISAEIHPPGAASTTTRTTRTRTTTAPPPPLNHPHHHVSDIHATLWGNEKEEELVVWEEEEEEEDVLRAEATLNIPRGGTDETTPHNNDYYEKQHDKKEKPQNQKKKKKKKRLTKKEQPLDDDNDDTTATTSSSSSSYEEPRSNPMMDDILQHDDYYDILGLSRGDDNPARIKKAYRRRAVQTHPDKTGGDRRAFDKLAEAYDVLLDEEKRTLYDRYGKDGLDPTSGVGVGSGMMGAEDLFRSFFGDGTPFFQQRPGQQQQRASPTINRTLRYQLDVTLEEMYKGKTRKVTVEAPPAASTRGLSYFVPPPPAEESKKKTVEVTIPRGARPGQSIVLSGAMDFDSHDSPPGDLIFQVFSRPHKTFTRKGHDLAMELTISFQEAICGCTRTIRHLDGRTITIESAKHHLPSTSTSTTSLTNPGSSEVENVTSSGEETAESITAASAAPAPYVYIQTGDVQVLKGKGMPKNPQGTEFGDLYIQYKVELPRGGSTEALTPSERIELARLLDKMGTSNHNRRAAVFPKKKVGLSSTTASSSSSANHYTLEPAKLSDFGHASGPVPPVVDDHDDPHHSDEHHHQQHQQQFQFPFGGSGRQFFFSSTGRSPFFGQENNFEDDENVQCRQM